MCVLKRLRKYGVFPYKYVEDAAPFSQRLLEATLEW